MKQALLMMGIFMVFQLQAQLFTPESFIQQIKQFHPIAKQANLQIEKAKADLQSAKGGFDPSFNFNASNKTFDGKNYYNYSNPELKIPTGIAGVDIKTGLENNGGKYLNPELSSGQTSYLGIEMPLGKGLLLDKRRATIQQAKIFQSQSQQDQLKMLNDLLFNAYNTYWQWAGAYQILHIYQKYYQISTERLRLVRIAYNNGDRAAMDTLEALTQVSSYESLLADASQKINTTSLEMSNFLWLDNDSAYQLPKQYFPDTLQFLMPVVEHSLDELINKSSIENPSLKAYDFKLKSLDVEKKLKFQNMLPLVNLKANLLNAGYNVVKGIDGNFLQNNYKWGIDVKLPILIREGRGDYTKSKLKIQETNLEFITKKWETENKIRNYYNEASLLQAQIKSVESAYNGYLILFKAENLKFYNGESSLFLVNNRETKLIEAAEKLVNLRVKYFKATYAAKWAAGLLK